MVATYTRRMLQGSPGTLGIAMPTVDPISWASLRRRASSSEFTEPVSTVLEMTEIHRRLLPLAGPAVLFIERHPLRREPSPMPCLVNLFGTVTRVSMGP